MATLKASPGVTVIETHKSTTATCMTCRLTFASLDDQREHYKTDLHKFNLKRKVAELPPVTAQQFEEKAKLHAKETAVHESEPVLFNCSTCNKKFHSEPVYLQHMNSKKHQQNMSQGKTKPEKSPKSEKPMDVGFSKAIEITEDMTEEQMIDAKIKNARPIAFEECLFCLEKSEDFNKNYEHMRKSHGFFVPDQEFLTNPQGLFKYLAQKISVGNICLFCNGKGKFFHTLEAVQKHMRDLSHCKIAFEETDQDELDEFYDYSKGQEPKDENEEIGDLVEITDDGSLKFKDSGRIVGHRDYRVYYKQNVRVKEESQAVSLQRKETFERLAQYSGLSSDALVTMASDSSKVLSLMLKTNQDLKYEAKQKKMGERNPYAIWKMCNERLRIGLIHNNQKHYKDRNAAIF